MNIWDTNKKPLKVMSGHSSHSLNFLLLKRKIYSKPAVYVAIQIFVSLILIFMSCTSNLMFIYLVIIFSSRNANEFPFLLLDIFDKTFLDKWLPFWVVRLHILIFLVNLDIFHDKRFMIIVSQLLNNIWNEKFRISTVLRRKLQQKEIIFGVPHSTLFSIIFDRKLCWFQCDSLPCLDADRSNGIEYHGIKNMCFIFNHDDCHVLQRDRNNFNCRYIK